MNKELILETLKSIKNNGSLGISQYNTVCDIIADLTTELAVDAAKKAGRTDVYKACKAVLKTAEKTSTSYVLNKLACHAGRVVACDGHRIIETAPGIDLPTCDTHENAAYPRVWDIVEKAENAGFTVCEAVPDMITIKQGINTVKARAKLAGVKACNIHPAYRFKSGWTVNAAYLADAVLATGAAEISHNGGPSGGLMTSKDGETKCFMLPIRYTGPDYGFINVGA